jgi:hypothetical protein
VRWYHHCDVGGHDLPAELGVRPEVVVGWDRLQGGDRLGERDCVALRHGQEPRRATRRASAPGTSALGPQPPPGRWRRSSAGHHARAASRKPRADPLAVVRSAANPLRPWMARRLNQERTSRFVAESSHAVEPFVRAIPTSVRVASPLLISMPVAACVAWTVVDASRVSVPADMKA